MAETGVEREARVVEQPVARPEPSAGWLPVCPPHEPLLSSTKSPSALAQNFSSSPGAQSSALLSAWRSRIESDALPWRSKLIVDRTGSGRKPFSVFVHGVHSAGVEPPAAASPRS